MSYVGLYEDCGSRNTFYRLKNRRGAGFKGFESKEEADFAHRIQSKLSQDNLAPRVYSMVGRIMIPDSYDDDEMVLSNWGYVTEIAKPMRVCYNDNCDGECYGSGCYNSVIIDDIVDRLREAGLEYIDGHRGNFGFVRRNKQWVPVVIDVGSESFGDIDERLYGEVVECSCEACRVARGEI
jgi:hypothetical protein